MSVNWINRVATKSVEVTDFDIHRFVELSGDNNPIHTDDVYSAGSIFGKRIAPGMMIASHISAVIANDLPGPGAIYLQQDLQFRSPVFIGDVIQVRVRVVDMPRFDRLLLETDCLNQDGVLVISGKALVKIRSEA